MYRGNNSKNIGDNYTMRDKTLSADCHIDLDKKNKNYDAFVRQKQNRKAEWAKINKTVAHSEL